MLLKRSWVVVPGKSPSGDFLSPSLKIWYDIHHSVFWCYQLSKRYLSSEIPNIWEASILWMSFFVLEGLEVFFAIYPSYIERPPFSLRGDMGLLRPDTETSQPRSWSSPSLAVRISGTWKDTATFRHNQNWAVLYRALSIRYMGPSLSLGASFIIHSTAQRLCRDTLGVGVRQRRKLPLCTQLGNMLNVS